MVTKGTGEIILRRGPFLGQGFAVIDFERGAISRGGLVEEPDAVGSGGSGGLPREGTGEIVLSPGPILGRRSAGEDFERGAISRDGLGEEPDAFGSGGSGGLD